MIVSGKNSGSVEQPVMCCQTAESVPTPQLVRGAAPSTPKRRRSEQRAMSEQMFFRCTKEERAEIEANAETVGLERSSYLRTQSLASPKRRAIRQVRRDWNTLQHCLGKINQAGNVLNQLVAQIRKPLPSDDPASYGLIKLQGRAFAALEEMRVCARAIVVALKQDG